MERGLSSIKRNMTIIGNWYPLKARLLDMEHMSLLKDVKMHFIISSIINLKIDCEFSYFNRSQLPTKKFQKTAFEEYHKTYPDQLIDRYI
jgi:hypothetical protein